MYPESERFTPILIYRFYEIYLENVDDQTVFHLHLKINNITNLYSFGYSKFSSQASCLKNTCKTENDRNP